jgi:penicillin-binding protein 2
VTPEFTMHDVGFYQLKGEERQYRDWKREGHGLVNMNTAIRESCDTYYYELAFRLGIDRMHEFGRWFGLGSATGIDIPSERRGLWPSRQWKREHRGLPWFPGDTLNAGIGQGDVLATPLQLAVMTAVHATHGKPVVPRLVQGQEVELPPALVDVAEEDWQFITQSMVDVLHHPRGTAFAAGRGMAFTMAGKSGTAQVVGIAQGEEYDSEALAERLRDHALFVGFAPVENPQIAVAVIVENGEGGSSKAAPAVRKVMESYFQQRSQVALTQTSVTEASLSHTVTSPIGAEPGNGG